MKLFGKTARSAPSPADRVAHGPSERRHLDRIAALRFVNDHVALSPDLRPDNGLVRSVPALRHVI